MKGSAPQLEPFLLRHLGDGMDLPHFGAHVAGFEQAEDIFEFRSAEEPDAAQILLGAMEHPA